MKVDILFKGLSAGSPESEAAHLMRKTGEFETRRLVMPIDSEDNPHPPVNPRYASTSVTTYDVAQTHARFPLPKSTHFCGFDAAPPARVERTGRIVWSYVVAETDDDAARIEKIIGLLAHRQ